MTANLNRYQHKSMQPSDITLVSELSRHENQKMTPKTNKRKPQFSRIKKSCYSSAVILSSIILTLFAVPVDAQSKPISRQAFAGGLVQGCTKNRKKETCLCYAKAVVSRYNSAQLDAMYRQMKSKPESRKMFFLVHSPEMNLCISRQD